MPRFPTYQRQQGLSGGATASYAGDAIAATARALQGLGAGVAEFGGDIAASLAKTRESQDDTWFSKARAETALDMIGQEQEAQQSATNGAENYTAGMSQRYTDYRQQKVAGAPSKRAAEMYDQWADSFSVSVVGNAAKFQAESELAKRTTDFADAMNAHAQAIYADPSQYDTVYKRAMDDFEGAKQWMTPEQEQISREKVDHDLKLARAKSLVDFSPSDFQQQVAGGDPAQWRRAIASIESAGSYDAIGPTHPTLGRALGKYQIMEANITRWSQDAIGRAVTSEEFLKSPKIQDAIFDHVFGGYVKRFGLEGAAQAWFAGPGGVGQVDRKDSLGTDVGSYGQKFMKALGASGVVSDPRFAGLSVDEIRSLSTQADQAVNAERAAAYTQAKDAIELGIVTGDVISEDQILGAGLRDGDTASMLTKFRSQNEENGDVAAMIGALARGEAGGVNAYDSKAVGIVDKAFDIASAGRSDALVQGGAEDVVQQTGIVPKSYYNGIRQGLESTNVQEVGAAAEKARRINMIDPAAFGRRDGGSQVEKDAIAYSHYVDNVGLSPEQAAKRLIDMHDPEKVKARASLMDSKPVTDWIVKQATENKVRDIFDPGVFGFDPALGTNPAQSAAMVGEYKSILEESLWDAAGDQELAKTYADQRFSQRYGTSAFTLDGDTVVTRLPPEKTYPAGADGTHEYIRDQALSALKEEGIETDKVYLQSDDITNNDFVRGQPARYLVYYEKDGQIEQFNLPFYAVPEKDANIPSRRVEESKARRNDNLDFRQKRGNLEEMMRQDAVRGSEVPSPLIGQEPDAVR